MKISAIDVGSNSVRLLLWADGRTVCKKLKTTRLGEGLSLTGKITKTAIERTADAIADFQREAVGWGAEHLYVFATAAARRAENGSEFVRFVRQRCGIDVDVISGECEAELGLLGALEGKDGGMIDVGGASSEVTVGKGGKIVYASSMDLGAVRLKDLCGDDRQSILEKIENEIHVYGSVPQTDFVAVGGTATSVVALDKKMVVYEPDAVHGSVLDIDRIIGWADRLLSMTQEERIALPGMDPARADILGGGALLLAKIMQYIGLTEIVVSEKDNLEGYVLSKLRDL